ncbi:MULTISPECIES: hypothetical protein [unclassified Streptomyces]|uniref:hypothetical protein n=1 Tax=unclassified Streptomyces TaxID=2593676 RepID=UPI00074AA365|nr:MULTISPECIES: hypothetical protein [unclassified Streptomyces]KUL73927.1 hypothetical protein ADL34_18855 [Streptomyces sp. NRRL WC-3605]KUL74356.1 hypothetical protein ADL33_17835 [Streptomyces sp. NRRL WC-3604]
MTHIDRTPAGTDDSGRAYAWAAVLTTLATLATVLALAFTGNEEAAIAVAAAGILSGVVVKVTVQIHRK